MATHSSILAWRISQTEEPGRLQSIGLQDSDMTEATQHVCRSPITRAEHKALDRVKEKPPRQTVLLLGYTFQLDSGPEGTNIT